MAKLIKEHVNRINTPTWVACNDDAQSIKWRSAFLKEHGGEFRKGKHWFWSETKKPIKKDPIVIPNQKFFLFLKEGNIVKVNNMTRFCRDRNYSRAAMYEVISGKRKSYKGHVYMGEMFDDLIVEQ
jgi:hypothetical protein